MSLTKRSAAEFLGTFWLVLGGCGSAVLAAAFPTLGIGFVGVSLAFGLTVLTMAYAIGHVSGCHLNPAVSVGLVAGGRFPAGELAPYVLAQVARRRGRRGCSTDRERQGGLRAWLGGSPRTAIGEHSPGGYTLRRRARVRGGDDLRVPDGDPRRDRRARAGKGFAPIAIGLALTLIHLISIPVTNTSVNPARSTGQALFVGDWALSQLWLFWVAPIAGAALAGLTHRWLSAPEPAGTKH
jgi:aquaporin Z